MKKVYWIIAVLLTLISCGEGCHTSIQANGIIPVSYTHLRPLIDYVFVRNGFDVLRYGVLAETENEAFLSDHAPVLVTVE